MKRNDEIVQKEGNVMGVQSLSNERYCTVRESIAESFKEIKLMQEGKLPKKTWKAYLEERENKRGS